MAVSLQKGQKVSLSKENPGLSRVVVGLGWDEAKPAKRGLFGFGARTQAIDCDASALLCVDGKIQNTKDVVFYNNLTHPSGAVKHMGDNLTGAGEGKYVRIVTKFTSNLGTEQTDIPVLYTYTLKAGESTAAWNTYADWAKGTFADGAGHQSSDAYRALSEDFDDYAGEVDEGKPVEQTAASSETTQTGTAATTESTTETKPEQPKEAGWDVDDSHWAAKTIRAMMAEGVLEGDADGRIRPDDKITREEMIWVMNTMLGIKPKADTKLDAADRSSEWAYGALAAAKDAGILQGDEFGYLCGSDYATRAEIITMIARACKVSSDDRSVLAGFTDAADIPDWAVSALAGMAEQGSLSGYTDGTLQPNDQITRAEAFSLLYEAITVGEPAQAA